MELITKTLFTLALILMLTGADAKQKRNLLTDAYSRKYLNSVMDFTHNWVNYPAYSDRAAWERLPADIRKKTIETGEKYLSYSWPYITATMYLEFARKGNREAIDRPNSERRRALQSLVLAELMEGKGRFFDDLVNGIFLICEQTYWGSSAHFYLHGFDKAAGTINDPFTVVPDLDDPIIDLMAGDMAADLAWTWYFFHGEFDKISTVVSRRIKYEIQNKILEPYYQRYDFWWMIGWGEGDKMFVEGNWTMNNWTAWITSNMLTTILLMEDDRQKKLNGVYKTIQTMNDFLNIYPSDGACDEGPGYWRHAAGKMFDYLYILHRNTKGKIAIFDHELVKNMGRYIYRVYIGKGKHYVNFSSAAPVIGHDGGHIYRYGRAIGDEIMKKFGAYLLSEDGYGANAVGGSLGTALENLFGMSGWQDTTPAEPLLPEFYFPESQIALARDRAGSTDGFYFAAWGGDNGGGHNHNDNGSFILYFNGDPVFLDVGRRGVGTEMHNLPLINGVAQPRGAIYKTVAPTYKSSMRKVSFSCDIAPSYPPIAMAQSWVRTYILYKGKRFTINDSYILKQNNGATKIHFMATVPCKILHPGTIELEGNGFVLHLKYNPAYLTAEIENGILRDEIARIVFTPLSTTLAGEFNFEITKS